MHTKSSQSDGENRSPADERGDDDAPGGAAAVRAGLLGVSVRVRRVVPLTSPAAEPERVEEEKDEVQAQTQQRHRAQQQNGLERGEIQKEKQCQISVYVERFLSNFSPYHEGRLRKWVIYTGSTSADMSRNQDTKTDGGFGFSCADRHAQISLCSYLRP